MFYLEQLQRARLNPKTENIYTLIIEKGVTLNTISNNLNNIGVINNEEVFKLFVRLSNYEKSIKAGQYKISNNTSIKDILVKLDSGQIIQNRLTIPEGITNAMVFEMINSIEYLSGKLELKNFPLEGFIAPDTYF